MVDFDKLLKKGKKPAIIEPRDIFRRLPKPDGINDLYASQTEVLGAWFRRRTDRDVVIKLHTGGGKTLVVRHVIIFGYGHGLQRAIIDESQHRIPERLVMAQH